jgi:hypothetical protein
LRDSNPEAPDLIEPEGKLAVHFLSYRKGYNQIREAKFDADWLVLGISLNYYVKLWWEACDMEKKAKIAEARVARDQMRSWLEEEDTGRGFLAVNPAYQSDFEEKEKRTCDWLKRKRVEQDRREELRKRRIEGKRRFEAIKQRSEAEKYKRQYEAEDAERRRETERQEAERRKAENAKCQHEREEQERAREERKQEFDREWTVPSGDETPGGTFFKPVIGTDPFCKRSMRKHLRRHPDTGEEIYVGASGHVVPVGLRDQLSNTPWERLPCA